MSTSTSIKKLSMAAAGAAFIVVGTLGTSQAKAVTIDFETLPGGGAVSSGLAITNQYAIQCVTFSTIENDREFAAYLFSYGNPGSAIFNTISPKLYNPNNRADILKISFSNPVAGLQFDFNGFGFNKNSTLFKAFDSMGNLLESFSVVNTSNYVPVVFSSSGISQAEVFQPREDWGYGIDNLQFEPQATQAVPEPASVLGLLTIGALGAGSTLKRKLQQKG